MSGGSEVTTQFINDGGNVIAEITGEKSQTYIRGKRLIAMQDEDGEWSIFGNNYRGDVERVQRGSYSNGRYNNRYAYDAFGNYSEETDSPKKNPFRYSGEYTDDETGLIYLRNRYYDPAIGRFITEDPAKDGLNWYAYCGNNPINCVDPLGLYKLERDEDGEIYAIIEKGDSLSKIAIDQVNDASAWKKMKYDGNPNEIQIGQRINIKGIYNQQYPAYNVVANVDKLKDKIRSSAKSLPFFGTPNSTRVLYNPDGTPK